MRASFCLAALVLAIALAPLAVHADNRLFQGDRLVTGDRISVEMVGNGPDVLFIPGLASSRETWRRTAERLRGRYRLHLVQVDGFAGEPPGANARGPLIAPTVETIHAYLTKAGLKHVPVVGHSLGGVMALELALDHPENVSKAMVVDTLAFYPELFAGPAATVEGAKPFADQMSAAAHGATAAQAAAASAQLAAAMATDEEGRKQIAAWSKASDRDAVATALSEDMLTDLRPRVGSLNVPLTVIYEGPLEKLMQADYAPVRTKTLVAAAPGAKHFIMFDDPSGFDRALDAFLSK